MKIKENEFEQIKKEVTRKSGRRYRFDCYQYDSKLDYYSDHYEPLDEDDRYYGRSSFTLINSSTGNGFRPQILCGGYHTQFLPDIQSVVRRWDFLEYQTPEVEPRILSYIKFIREYKMLHDDMLFLILVPYEEEKHECDSESEKVSQFLELNKVRSLQTSLSNIPGVREALGEQIESFQTLVDMDTIHFIFYSNTSTAAGIQASIFTDIYGCASRPCMIITPDISRFGFDFNIEHKNSEFEDTVKLDMGLIEYIARGIQVVECTKSSMEPDYPYQVYFANSTPSWYLSYVHIPESTLYNDTTLNLNPIHHKTMIGGLDEKRYCECIYTEYGGDESAFYNNSQTLYYYLQEMLFRHDISYAKSNFKVIYIPFEGTNEERVKDRAFLGHHTETLIIHGETSETILSMFEKLNLFHLPDTNSLERKDDPTDVLDWRYLIGSKNPLSDIEKNVPYEQYVFLDGRLFKEPLGFTEIKELLKKLNMLEGENFRVHLIYVKPRS